MTSLLTMSNCALKFGGLTAVNDFNLSLNEGELVGLIGPNGAGKTCVFNLLTGIYKPEIPAFAGMTKVRHSGVRHSGESDASHEIPTPSSTAGDDDNAGDPHAASRLGMTEASHPGGSRDLPRHPGGSRHPGESRDLPRHPEGSEGSRVGIYFSGVDITKLPPFKINQIGIARTFQSIRLFNSLSVLENVRMGYHHYLKHGSLEAVLRTRNYYIEEERIFKECLQLLKIFGLEGYIKETAKHLPYGEQRRLEIVRALATKPKLLLLDEPAAGMNPQEKAELKGLIKKIRKEFNLTILLIEHDMPVVMDLCERIIVLDHGETIATGKPEEVRRNPKVIEAYLGEANA